MFWKCLLKRSISGNRGCICNIIHCMSTKEGVLMMYMYNPPNSIMFQSDIQACISKAVQLSWKLLSIPRKYM